jgi:hypothetical protein
MLFGKISIVKSAAHYTLRTVYLIEGYGNDPIL